MPVFLLKPKKDFFAREGFFTVGLIWVLFGVFGALPFWFSGQFGPYVDCFLDDDGDEHALLQPQVLQRHP